MDAPAGALLWHEGDGSAVVFCRETDTWTGQIADMEHWGRWLPAAKVLEKPDRRRRGR